MPGVSEYINVSMPMREHGYDCQCKPERRPVWEHNTAFTHSCLCLASPLARTFVCFCLFTNELSSHAYEHSYVRTHNANRHSSPLTRVQKTASRASATNGEANNATNDEANMWSVRSSFALLFASPLARMCKYGISVKANMSLIMNPSDSTSVSTVGTRLSGTW